MSEPACEAPKKRFTPLRILLIALPILYLIAQEIRPFGPSFPGNRASALLLMMALWWVTETFPLHWVALLPLIVVPLFPSVLEKGQLLGRWDTLGAVALPYVNPFIMVFMGGMLIGVAMEAHDLHRRIALNIMRAIGSSPVRILLGFVVATAFLSLWISNTATAVMMVPIALAVIAQLEAREGRRLPLLGQSIMLAVAYGANVGGIGTLIGTAPNMALAGFVSTTYKQPVNFLEYLSIGLPFVLLMLPVVFVLLRAMCLREPVRAVESDVIDVELAKLGRMSRMEKTVLGVFLFTSLMWILNQPLQAALDALFPGSWAAGLKGDKLDAFWALLAPVLLLVLGPLRPAHLRRMPWDVLILLGGSYALARVVQGSELSKWLVGLLGPAAQMHPLLLMMAVTSLTIVLTAFTANAASANLMMILITDALDPARLHPGRTMPYLYGATIASSCDFMLPCGTPPNAIVFGTRYVSIRAMAGAGFLLNLSSAILVALWMYFGASRWL
ncbi:MAG TPA: DASS family sodium-coupled anion symporter [Planctomycetota bacterium]|nr:DASS family sodium-coupled anion symporter [Planctomycetota bacterium]